MKCQYFLLLFFFSSVGFSDSKLLTVLKQHNVAGGTCVFYTDGALEYVSEGAVSLHSVVPVNEHTLFRIGTLTTLFTSHILAQLTLEHRVDLDDPASKFLSRRQTVPHFGAKEITLFELATHTSGLPSNAFVSNEPALLQSRALYSFLNSHTLNVRPGQKVVFSPVGFVLLNAVLTRASKEPMDALVQKIVCKKFGMEDTTYSLTRSLTQTISSGHVQKQLLSPKDQENRGSAFYDALGLYSSAFDMGKLLQFYLKESGETQQVREVLFKKDGAPMGLCMRDARRGAYELSSSLMGYSAYFAYDTQSKKGIVLLFNKEDVPIEDIGRSLLYDL